MKEIGFHTIVIVKNPLLLWKMSAHVSYRPGKVSSKDLVKLWEIM